MKHEDYHGLGIGENFGGLEPAPKFSYSHETMKVRRGKQFFEQTFFDISKGWVYWLLKGLKAMKRCSRFVLETKDSWSVANTPPTLLTY